MRLCRFSIKKKIVFLGLWIVANIYVIKIYFLTKTKMDFEDYIWKEEINYKFNQRIVHLDLKGAPISIFYLKQLLPIFKRYKVTGILMEYEDMFPYDGTIIQIKREDSYNEDNLQDILTLVKSYNINIIPLIQTFGHMEYVLKHSNFRHLREDLAYSDVICPTQGESFQLIKIMIDQVVQSHKGIDSLHIGSDEVYHIGKCPLCAARLKQGETRDQIFLEHTIKVATYIKGSYPSLRILMWDDMLRHIPADLLKKYKLGDMVELVIWDYRFPIHHDISADIFRKYHTTFGAIWGASAFKGATGEKMQVTNVGYHLSNNYDWLKIMREDKGEQSKSIQSLDNSVGKHEANVLNLNTEKIANIRGIILTGWQRYSHFRPLCELLPSGLPSLLASLTLLNHGKFSKIEHTQLSAHSICAAKFGDLNKMELEINHQNDFQNVDSLSEEEPLCPIIYPFKPLDPKNQSHQIFIEQHLTFPGHEIYTLVKKNYNSIAKFFDLNNILYENNFKDIQDLKIQFQDVRDELMKQREFVRSDGFSKYFHGVSTAVEWIDTFIEPYLNRIQHVLALL